MANNSCKNVKSFINNILSWLPLSPLQQNNRSIVIAKGNNNRQYVCVFVHYMDIVGSLCVCDENLHFCKTVLTQSYLQIWV